MLKPKLLKTCDNCKLRKVRCTGEFDELVDNAVSYLIFPGSRQPSSMPCGICLVGIDL